MSTIPIRGVKEPFGWMGNMSPHPVKYGKREFKTSEHLFQWGRFEGHPQIQEEIFQQKSPMGAKMKAKKHRRLLTEKGEWKWDEKKDTEWMETCLLLKLESNPALIEELMATGETFIVEDCSKRKGGSGMFWGAALKDGEWVGENVLGSLWMEIREAFLKGSLRMFNSKEM